MHVAWTMCHAHAIPKPQPANDDTRVTAAPRSTADRAAERWRMGPEARAMVLISAVLTAFGLAVLYSASAFVAMNEHHGDSCVLPRESARGVGSPASSSLRSPPSSTRESSRSGRGRSCGSRSPRMAAVLVLPSSHCADDSRIAALSRRLVVPAVGVRRSSPSSFGCRCSS